MKIFCDASFDSDKKVAGIGIVINKKGVVKKPISFWIKCPNNNYAELYAVYISAILSGGEKCTIITDSQNTLDYINGNRDDKYEEKHKYFWNKEQYINHKQMLLLAYKIKRVSNKLSFEKTKAHTKNFQEQGVCNNLSDLIAKLGRSKYYKTR